MEHIGGRIAALRKERGLTQEQLGRQVGVSAQAVSKWENGGAPDVELLPAPAGTGKVAGCWKKRGLDRQIADAPGAGAEGGDRT